MYKTTFITFLMATALTFGQSLPYDYEDGALTATFQFGGLTYSNIANPDSNGNTSSRVLQVDKPAGSEWFGGFGYGEPTGAIIANMANGTAFTLNVWSTKANLPIRFELQRPGEVSYNVIQTVATANTWVELTFDFSSQVNGTENYSVIVIQPDYNSACEGGGCPQITVGGTYYFDNITQVGAPEPTCTDGIQNGSETGVDCGGPDCTPCTPTCSDGIQNGNETGVDCGGPDCAPCIPTVPLTAAPTPTLMQSQVINMYSNAYTQDVNVSSWRSSWSTSTYTDNVLVDGPGSETKRYIDADFVGVEFYGPDAVDATTMNYFHLDVWSPNATLFRVKLVDLDAGVVEGEIAFTIPQGQWVKLDIPLVDFADPTKVTNPANLLNSRNSIQQLIFSGQPTGTFDFYVDNIYFATDVTLSTTQFESVNVKVYPNPTQTEWTVDLGNNIIKNVQLYDILGKQVLSLSPNASTAKIDASQLNKGLYFATVISDNGNNTIKLIKN